MALATAAIQRVTMAMYLDLDKQLDYSNYHLIHLEIDKYLMEWLM